MIQLRFTTTKEAFEFNSPPEEEHPAVLTETCFVMPVFFVVNEVNLLGFPNGATMQLSILGFALSLRNAVARLESGGQERVLIGGAGTLFLQEAGGSVSCSTTTLPAQVQVSQPELQAAVNAFATEVARVILGRFPEMEKHPDWPRWFPMRGGPGDGRLNLGP